MFQVPGPRLERFWTRAIQSCVPVAALGFGIFATSADVECQTCGPVSNNETVPPAQGFFSVPPPAVCKEFNVVTDQTLPDQGFVNLNTLIRVDTEAHTTGTCDYNTWDYGYNPPQCRLMQTTKIASLCAIAGTVLTAQRHLTIPEAVERMRPQLCHSGVCEQYATSKVRELAPHPFERAVHESDFIVVGTLRKVASYLSSTQTELYTDYELTPTNVIAQRAISGTRALSAPQRLLVRQWGGETVINGISVVIKDEPFPFLPTNTPVLLLLKYDAASGKYEVYDGGTGAFAIDGPSLRHLLAAEPAAYERFKGMKASDAIREIHQLGR